MGTIFEEGKKPKNKITLSKGDGGERKIDMTTGKTDRGFAQQNPNTPARDIEPKAHASAQDEVEALNKNSTKGRSYVEGDEDGDKDGE